MKNIEKKWLLFTIATVVTSFGIGYTLLKGTSATTDTGVVLESTGFEDINFYRCVVEQYNKDNDTSYDYMVDILSDEQLKNIDRLSCFSNGDIVSIVGIEKLSSLTSLDMFNNKLTVADLSNNIALTSVRLSMNQLTTLDLGNNVNITDLGLGNNKLTELDVSKSINLEYLNISSNQLTDIDVSENTNLDRLELSDNELTDLDLNNNIYLEYLDVSGNHLTELDVSNNTNLVELYVFGNQLTNLNVDNNTELTHLYVGDTDFDAGSSYEGNLLTEINLESNIKLQHLSVALNQLTSLDVSNNKELIELIAYNNLLTEINLENNSKLEMLSLGVTYGCSSASGGLACSRKYGNNLTELDVSNNINLTKLYVSNNQLIDLDLSKNNKLENVQVGNNELTNLTLSDCTNLSMLVVSDNNLSSLDLSNLTNIEILYVENNQLTDLDLSAHTMLEYLELNSNLYSEELYAYKGHNIVLGNNVKIPGQLKWGSPIWTSNDTNVVVIDEDGIITAINSGIAEVTGVVSNRYTTTSTVNVVEITSDKYDITTSHVVVSDFNDVSYDEFCGNIVLSDEAVVYKIYNDGKEITDGMILEGMLLKVMYEDSVLAELLITEDYFEFDNGINVDETDMIVSNIDVESKVSNILDSNGDIQVLDKDDNVIEDTNHNLRTGDKIKVTFSAQVLEFTISVNGDITGDGDITKSDIEMLSKHIVSGDVIAGEEYLLASDYDGNEKVDINDVVKLAQYVQDNG